MRVEGIVLPAHDNEAAGAESSQDSARALVLVRGKEGRAQLVFQFWVEPGAGHDRLYRVRARGFDHAQLLPEGRPPGAVSERRSSRSPLSPPRPEAPPRWSLGGTRNMIRCRTSSRLFPTQQACSAGRSSRSASTRRCTPTSSLGCRRKFEPSVIAHDDVAEVDGLARISLVVEHGRHTEQLGGRRSQPAQPDERGSAHESHVDFVSEGGALVPLPWPRDARLYTERDQLTSEGPPQVISQRFEEGPWDARRGR